MKKMKRRVFKGWFNGSNIQHLPLALLLSLIWEKKSSDDTSLGCTITVEWEVEKQKPRRSRGLGKRLDA
jgi:hypothetical protein